MGLLLNTLLFDMCIVWDYSFGSGSFFIRIIWIRIQLKIPLNLKFINNTSDIRIPELGRLNKVCVREIVINFVIWGSECLCVYCECMKWSLGGCKYIAGLKYIFYTEYTFHLHNRFWQRRKNIDLSITRKL